MGSVDTRKALSDAAPIPRCRKCGGDPVLAAEDITGESLSYAYHCKNLCGNDTHWQMSEYMAAKLWRQNPCSGMEGGQGSPDQDRRTAQ